MHGKRTPWARIVCAALLVLPTLGCVRGCTSTRPPIHPNPNMDYQPKYQAQAESDFFYDGSAMRLPVEGTVRRGGLRENAALYTGRDAAGEYLASSPVGIDEAVLARGAERYAIYCRPCHDKRGNGKGILFERGGVPMPAYTDERLMAVPDGELFDVITNGKGLMTGYGWPIPAADRWAIIAHVRRLQQEQAARNLAAAGR